MGYSEEFRQLRPHLRGVPVSGLAPADDEVERTGRPQRLTDRVTGGEHVGSGKLPVGNQYRVVDAHHVSLAQNLLRLRRPHGERGHFGSELFLEPERRLQRVEVVRVEFRLNAVTFQRAGNRIDLHLRGSRHLLDADCNLHPLIPV